MTSAKPYRFAAQLWQWDARKGDSWFFLTLPADVSDEIGVRFGGKAAGFGSLRVEVTVGATTWRTSIFPDKARGYVLPVKQAVRKAEHLDDGSTVKVALRVVA